MLALTTRPRAANGFTLIELLVTIAIVAILGMVAVPSFVSFQRNSEMTGAVNSLLAAVNTARSEAMKRNLRAVVTPYNGSSWLTGWKVFADIDKSGTLTANDEVVAQRDYTLPSYFAAPVGTSDAAEATANGPYIMFDGSGFATTRSGSSIKDLSIKFSRTDDTSVKQIRYLMVGKTGRARVCTPTSATDSTCTTAP